MLWLLIMFQNHLFCSLCPFLICSLLFKFKLDSVTLSSLSSWTCSRPSQCVALFTYVPLPFKAESCPTLCDPMDCAPAPRVCSDSCPLSWWCHPTILSSVIPFSCPQCFSASGSFPVSWFFASGGQSTGVSASASVLPMNIQDWFPLGLTGLISLQSKRLSRVFSSTTVQKHQFFGAQPSLWSNSDIHT